MSDKRVDYVVSCMDWLPVESDKLEEGGLFDGLPMMIPSDKEVDDRTARSYSFKTLEEAETYYDKLVQDKTGDEWTAYIKLKKCVIEVVKKYSSQKENI